MKKAAALAVAAAVLSIVIDGALVSIICGWFNHPISLWKGIVIASTISGLIHKSVVGRG